MTSQVDFGLWYDFRNPEPWQIDFEQFYSERLDQIAGAETMGFDSVWLTEHHFVMTAMPPHRWLFMPPSPPERSACVWAPIDALAPRRSGAYRRGCRHAITHFRGRFDLGVGIGYRQLEFDQFGRKISHRPSLVEEGIEIIRRGWSGEAVNFEGSDSRWVTSRLRPSPTAPEFCWAVWHPPPSIAPHALPTGFCALGYRHGYVR